MNRGLNNEKKQSGDDLAFHRKCKGPGARISLACQGIFVRPERLGKGVKAGRGDQANLYTALKVRKELQSYPMCHENPHEGLSREMD